MMPDMTRLEMVIGASAIPMLLVSFFLPESPRWLFATGQYAKASRVVLQVCRGNQRPCSEAKLIRLRKWFNDMGTHQPEAGNLWLMRKYPSCLRNLVCISFVWFATSMGYYGLVYNTPNFGRIQSKRRNDSLIS